MKIIAINGSPRANKNTATLLKKAVEGATSKGAEVEIINLYKLNYKGCISCFSCKRMDSKKPNTCAIKDDLTQVLEKIHNADAVIFGLPIYFNDITGQMRCFFERLLFQYLSYEGQSEMTYFPRKLKTAFIYTMGVPDGTYKDEVLENLKSIENFISMIFGLPVKTLYSNDAYQFDDYSKYKASVFDVEGKIKRRNEVFPIDCEKAFSLGVDLALDKN